MRALSEFAGCALSFKGAMLVNPYDPDKVAESIHTALAMPVGEQVVAFHGAIGPTYQREIC